MQKSGINPNHQASNNGWMLSMISTVCSGKFTFSPRGEIFMRKYTSFFQWTHYEQSRFIIHWGRVVLTDVPQYVCLIKTNKKKRKPPKIKNKVKSMGKSVNPFRQHILCNICLDNHCMCPHRRKNRRLADHGSLNIFLACVCCHRVVHGRIAI